MCLCCISTLLPLGVGILKSYSRGAWIAGLCGLIVLAYAFIKPKWCAFPVLICRKNLCLLTIVLSIVLLCYWLSYQLEFRPMQRISASLSNTDFSSYNRIAAWKGALQITSDYFLHGVGWNQTEVLYSNYYLQNKLCEGEAILMNDFLMLSTTLGISSLFCFGMYVWLSLTYRPESRKHKAEIVDEVDFLKIICRAGAIVLLVGFWFDGGLFKLPTAATFWILLELGRSQSMSERVSESVKVCEHGSLVS